ncbi:MAG: hypothetical protein KKB20_28210 [Proteobacteria bacterium]|nr:hypothetical protein [Pseudomonadota bacterium]
MLQLADERTLHAISELLAQGLPQADPVEIPADVAQTIERAREQMRNIPDCLIDLRAARQEFDTVRGAIQGLLELARRAAALPEDDQGGRDACQAEFVKLARVLAGTAGRRGYDQPQLSLIGKPQAKAAATALRYMVPVIEAEAERLAEQEALIHQVVEETVAFLEIVAVSYSDADSLSAIPDLLQHAKWVRGADRSSIRTGPALAGGLH